MNDPYVVRIPWRKAFLPAYHHLIHSTADIDFLWGGRDSGKSRFIASILIYACLHLKYFRCVLVRKVFATIKDSQWQTIKDVAEFWGVDHLFDFNTSPLEIRCIYNNNRFICRGFDEPAKLKSLSNISHSWCEEGNQLTLEDFIVLMTTLRSNAGRVKTWFSFNPEANGDFQEFWLYKTFFATFPGDIYQNFTYRWEIAVGSTTVTFTYQSTHTTYKDNRYCRPERAGFMEQVKELDPYYYQVFTLGKWGNRKVDDPFCYSFDRAKHVRPVDLVYGLELKLSFDFNVNPITCGVYQDLDTSIWCKQAIKLPNSDIYKLCDYIKVNYPGFQYMVTGDATGRNTSALVQDGINYYTVIQRELDLYTAQLQVPSVNPPIQENRVLVNSVFVKCDVAFDPEGAKDLIFDCQNVSVNEYGKIDKGDRANPKKRADHLDNWRYYLNTFQKHVLRM